MLDRHTNATFFNSVLNNCEVRPDVADAAEGELDLSAAVANENNVLLCGDHGGFMYFYRMPGMWEVHTAVLPSGRGRWAYEAAKFSLGLMFTKTPACEIITRIPTEHHGARRLAQRCGFRHEFTGEPGCAWRGKLQPAEVWSLNLWQWVLVDPAVQKLGARFHAELNEQAKHAGIVDAPHAPDSAHNAYVGAACAMIAGGQLNKAVNFYNRWAVAARHRIVALVNSDPPEISMDIGLLRFRGKGFELVRPS